MHDACDDLLGNRIVDPRNDDIVAASPETKDLWIDTIGTRQRSINKGDLVLHKKRQEHRSAPRRIVLVSERLRNQDEARTIRLAYRIGICKVSMEK